MALASDAVARDGALVGDPTEGALVVLAAKGGIDAVETRKEFPRVAEVPVRRRLQADGDVPPHDDAEDGREVIRCFVKGAPDQLLARGANALTAEGKLEPVDSIRDALSAVQRAARRSRACASWRSPAATSTRPRSTRARPTCCRWSAI